MFNRNQPKFETQLVPATDRRGLPVFEANPDQPGSFTRVMKEIQVPIVPENERPLARTVSSRQISLGRSAVKAAKPVLVREHYRNAQGGNIPTYTQPRHYRSRAEIRRSRRTKAEMDNMLTGSSWKAKAKRVGAIALTTFVIGWAAKEPVTNYVNQKVHDTQVAYEQNIVQPTQEFIHDTAVAYDENVVQPIENFKVETGKKFEAAKESVVTLGGLLKEEELVSPQSDSQLAALRGEQTDTANAEKTLVDEKASEAERVWNRATTIRPDLSSKITKEQFTDMVAKFGPELLGDIATAAEEKQFGEKEVTTRTSIAYKYLMSELGLKDYQAAGIVGNMVRESGVDPNKKELTSDPNNPDFIQSGKGSGINQWTSAGRQKNLVAFANKLGLPPTDFAVQLAFTKEEFTGAYKPVYEKLLAAKTIEEATVIAHDGYYISADDHTKIEQRIKFAQNLLTSDGVSAAPTPAKKL